MDDATSIAVVDSQQPVLGPRLVDGSARLRLVPLSVVPRGDELLVGDVSQGEFVVLPAIAGVILDGIAAGEQLARVAELARDAAGEEVDVLDFAESLLELGFVTHINGQPLEAERVRLHDGGRVGARLAELARPLFSRPAWIVYATLAVACAVLLLLAPRYRPHSGSLFFLHDPLASIALLGLIDSVLVALHEGAHWLSARVAGVPARITLGRRLYFLVAQTDLTSLLALPRRRRFGPLLAGMAFDTVVLALLLGAQIAAAHGLWEPPSWLARLITALVLLRLTGIGFQFLVYMRTDLYAVLVIGLDCLQLTRTTHLTVRRALRRLSDEQAAELAAADPRDLQTVRWYIWLYVAGLVWAAWFLATYAIPWIVKITGWIVHSLAHTSPGQVRFWESLVFAALALVPALLPVGMIIRERTRVDRPRTT